MPHENRLRLLICWMLLAIPGARHATQGHAEESVTLFDHWPRELTVGGSILLGGDKTGPETLSKALIGRELNGHITLLCDADLSPEEYVKWASLFHRAKEYHAVRLAEDPDLRPLKTLIAESDILVWRSLNNVNDRELQQLFGAKETLQNFVRRGGTLVAIGPASTVVGEKFHDALDSSDRWRQGLGLIPDAHLRHDDTPRARTHLQRRLPDYPGDVGLTIDSDTVLRLSGRILSPHGPGSATILIPKSDRGGALDQKSIREPSRIPRSSNEFLLDLTQWRRMSIDRFLPEFPSAKPPVPHVADGTLLIVGGGGMPEGLMDEFIRLAGGKEKAKLVYIPCSQQDQVSTPQRTVTQWRQMGVKHATMIHTKDRDQAHSDEQFLAPLLDATGIWFGGGRQWNFADSYYGTQAHSLMQQVLQRGGVVGGSSAGASIQAAFLARATPIENRDILAPGYLRGGLGFIRGVAIDQHFSQRRRQSDMTQLMKRYPQMLGIGIDESTALVVKKSIATVTGDGDVYFYDGTEETEKDAPDYIRMSAGEQYDLAARKSLSRAEPLKETVSSE